MIGRIIFQTAVYLTEGITFNYLIHFIKEIKSQSIVHLILETHSYIILLEAVPPFTPNVLNHKLLVP